MKPIRIIVIDDEIKMTKLLSLIIKDHFECNVETFNTPDLALERLGEVEFDVISMDHRMPRLTGMELANAIRSNPHSINRTTPILIFTGFREEAQALAIDLLDDLVFVEKPIDEARYVQYLKMALAMKRRGQTVA